MTNAVLVDYAATARAFFAPWFAEAVSFFTKRDAS